MNTLEINGRWFRDTATGKRWDYVGMAASALFRRWLMRKSSDGIDGPTELVLPNLQQWHAMATEGGYLGEIVLRVYRFAAPPNVFALDPWSYNFQEVTLFTNFCNERGFRVDWTGGDAQIVFNGRPSNQSRQQHTNEFANALAPVGPTNFFQALNEPFKNGGIEGFDIPASRMVVPGSPWGTYLRDSGVYYDGVWNKSTNLDFISCHTPRNSEGDVEKWKTKQMESAPYLWVNGPAPVQNEMMGFDEVTQGGRRSTDREAAMLQGLTVAMTGVGILCTDGHGCNQYGPVQRSCAVAYFAGAAAGVKASNP